jgi:hypothetical protein
MAPLAYSSFDACQYLPGLNNFALRAEMDEGEARKRRATRRRTRRDMMEESDRDEIWTRSQHDATCCAMMKVVLMRAPVVASRVFSVCVYRELMLMLML